MGAPRSFSSRRIAADSVGCDTWQASAARPKCFSRASATRYSSCRSTMTQSRLLSWRQAKARSIAGFYRALAPRFVWRSPYLTTYGASRPMRNGGPMPEAKPDNAPRSQASAIHAIAIAVVVVAVGVAALMLSSPPGGPHASLIGGPFALEGRKWQDGERSDAQGAAVPRLFRIHPLPRRLSDRIRAHFRHSDEDGKSVYPASFTTPVDPARDTPKV